MWKIRSCVEFRYSYKPLQLFGMRRAPMQKRRAELNICDRSFAEVDHVPCHFQAARLNPEGQTTSCTIFENDIV